MEGRCWAQEGYICPGWCLGLFSQEEQVHHTHGSPHQTVLTSPCNTQAGLGIAQSRLWLEGSPLECVRPTSKGVLGEKTSCTTELIFFLVGMFWLTLGKEVVYELLQRARTAASASVLVRALCSSGKIHS